MKKVLVTVLLASIGLAACSIDAPPPPPERIAVPPEITPAEEEPKSINPLRRVFY